jgi:hypothetical protein
MSESADSGWIEVSEPVGKTVKRIRYIDQTDYQGLEIDFTDGSVFLIEPRARIRARILDKSTGDVELLKEYGVLGKDS